MSALFLLVLPLVALAVYRVLAARHVPVAVAAGVALVLAVVATALPAWALRTKPSHGSPVETPVGPGFRSQRVELLVDYLSGWSPPSQVAGQTVRRLSGHGQLAVGPLQSRRPRATLSFQASAAGPAQLTVQFGGATVRRVRVGSRAARVSVSVPAGNGPAVFDLDVAGGRTLVVPVASVHAVVETD